MAGKLPEFKAHIKILFINPLSKANSLTKQAEFVTVFVRFHTPLFHHKFFIGVVTPIKISLIVNKFNAYKVDSTCVT